MNARLAWAKLVCNAAAMALLASGASAACASTRLVDVHAAELPQEAYETLALIRRGGPFPHERDGVRFGNRERLLPQQRGDYYREYTVRTPGAKDRGARRIVCGGAPREPDVCYYTADHYRSFARISE